MTQLAGTVNLYYRHLIVKTPNLRNWPNKIAFTSPFINMLVQHANRLKNPTKSVARIAPKITCSDFNTGASEKAEGYNQASADILIYPEAVMINNVKATEISNLIDWLNDCQDLNISLRSFTNAGSKSLAPFPVTTWHRNTFLVCTHMEMDCRCGETGGQVYEKLLSLNLSDAVMATSHIGGHEYAGNIIHYPANPRGDYNGGDWYGLVTPDNVEQVISTIKSKQIPKEHWRGRLGLSKEEQISLCNKL